jgi:hypothetical protein
MKQMKPKKSPNVFYECAACKYKSKNKKDFKKHLLTKKHKLINCETKKIPKNLECEYCNKTFKSRTTLWRHKKTCKNNIHKLSILSKKYPKVIQPKFECECGKTYKYASGLSKHKKKCKILHIETNETKNKTNIIPTNNVESLLKMILEENKILRTKISNLELGKTMINSNNNFNINMFLNEKCKNAMNLDDFVQKIKLTLEDLNYTKENGYAKGISNIFIKNLTDLDVTERPIHCSDQKRMKFYVKDADEWLKDENNVKIDNTIAKVSKKQIQNLEKWCKENPDYLDSDAKTQEYYRLVRNLSQPNDDKNLRSIKKKVGENVKIERVNFEKV